MPFRPTLLKIRKYRKSDFERLFEIDQAAFSKEIAYSHLELQYYLGLRNSRALVADDAGKVVGFVIACYEDRRLGHIITIDVVPHRQRQHIGSALLDKIERWLWNSGAEAIYLETAVDDTSARGFYERHGYFVLEEIDGYYNDTTSAFVMMKTAKRLPTIN